MNVEGVAVFHMLDELRESTNTCDFEVLSFSDARLFIIGSFDLDYYHEVEIAFEDVVYIELPTYFNRPALRAATPEEANAYAYLGLDPTEYLYVIEEDPYVDSRKYYVAARSVSARKCMVYHYRREELKDGEEIAPWVK